MIRVMIVDDEPLILDGLTYLLDWESLGFEVVAKARNGREALGLSRTIAFDVLITDIKMPEMTGLELIEALKEEQEGVKAIVLSGFQEFDLIKKGLVLGIENYLLKPVNENELVSSLLHIKDKLDQQDLGEESILILRDHSIWRYMMGKMPLREFQERLALYPELTLPVPFHLGLLKVEDSDSVKVQKQIETGPSICVTTPQGDLMILWDPAHVEAELERISPIVDERKGILVTSGRVEEIAETPRVMKELERASELKMILPDQEQHLAEDMILSPSIKTIDVRNYLKPEMLEGLANEEYGRVREELGNVFIQLSSDPFLLKSVFLDTFFQMKGRFLLSLEYGQYVQIIHEILHIEGEEDAMRLLDTCMKWMEREGQGEEKRSPIIQTVLTYIHQHYSEDMSLKTLGHRFHINPIYLGQLFQKEAGDSFTKYLNKLRIDRAKKLLLNSHEKAGQIGKRVGYTDATYFYKQFKKYENATPSEWRKQRV
jgi:two-component system, response regulator YesN